MVIVIPVFLAALVAVFLVVLVLFFGCYLGCSSVLGQGLDSCVVVWFSFLLLFWLALSLLSWLLFWFLLLWKKQSFSPLRLPPRASKMPETKQTRSQPNCYRQAWFQTEHPWAFCGHVSGQPQRGDKQPSLTQWAASAFLVLSQPCAGWRHIATLCRWPGPKIFA